MAVADLLTRYAVCLPIAPDLPGGSIRGRNRSPLRAIIAAPSRCRPILDRAMCPRRSRCEAARRVALRLECRDEGPGRTPIGGLSRD